MREHRNPNSWRHPGLLLFLFAASGLVACAGPSELQAEREMDKVIDEQKTARQTPPDAVGEALMPSDEPSESPQEPEAERFDVSVRDLPARSFFLGLVEDTDQNIVVHPDVSGTISLDLKGVTLGEVLKVARDIYGYEYQHSGNIYRIFPNEMRTHVFQIDYLDVQRVGVSDTGVSTGTAESDDSDDRRGGGSDSGGNGNSANLLSMLGGGEEGRSRSRSGLTPGSRVQTLNRTDFWGSLRQALTAMIGAESGGERMVMITPQSGMVVVKAMPHELASVRDFLERSELSIKRQVILEAKILEVQLNEGFEAGINWGEISGSLQNNFEHTRGASLDDTLTINRGTNGNFVSADQTTVDGKLRLKDNVFSSVLRVTDISELLSLLETQGNVQVLSSPRVSTVNNQKALIRVGTDEFFITDISNDTTSSVTSVTSTPDVELSSLFSGIALDVTPQIAEGGEVILHIHPIVSEVDDQLKNFIIGSEDFSLPLARRTVRESDSIVRARSGQVIVLGGLMQETNREEDGKRPGLGDIPLLNSLFRTRNTSREKTELVILLKPIVVEDDTWEQELERTGRDMEQMGDRYRELWDR